MHRFALLFLAIGSALLACCAAAAVAEETSASNGTPRLELPEVPYRYADVPLPKHFHLAAAEAFDTTPVDNPTTDVGATLGRALFYDTRLSINDSISCGSCHFQEHAFADPRQYSPGHAGVLVDRNAMSLVNLRYMRTGAFWDERGGTLEQQALMPIESPVEMGHDLSQVAELLAADERYRELFRAAFGDERIDRERIGRALAQFVRSLVSYQSKYDQGAAQVAAMSDEFPNFTAEENHGKSLFLANCAVCHRPARDTQLAHFDLFRSLNNGLDATAEVSDTGRGDVTFDVSQVGLFKPSSLRNVEFTAPYMHDGRLATLEEVVEHYSSGVQRNPAVSGNIFRMQFSDVEKRAIVAFLKTLSDEEFVTDPKFSDPWVREGVSPNKLALSERVATTSPSAPPTGKPRSAKEADAQLAAGNGLAPAETLPWLRRLDADADGDGRISMQEYRRVVEILADTDAALRPDELETNPLARRNRPATPASAYPPEIVAVADFDEDGELDAGESRRYELFRQFMQLRDGGRIESRLDGLLSNFATLLPADQCEVARRELQLAKHRLHREALALDAELLPKIRELLTPGEFSGLQLAALHDYGSTSGRSTEDRRLPAAIAGALAEHFTRFDCDGDGMLDDGELAGAARALNELPGGFGQRRGAGATVDQFTSRVLSFGRTPDEVRIDELPDRLTAFMTPADGDANKILTRQEVADFVRNEGFRQLAEHGVYVGGGFESVYKRLRVDKLSLTQSTQASLQALLDDYAVKLARLQDEAIVARYRRLRSRCLGKAELTAAE